jgi:predicted nucleic acid-binding protein
MFTLDASVFLRRASPNDPGYAVCRDLMDAIRTHAIPLYEPLLVLAEVAGAVSRIFREPMRGRIYADLLRELPHTTYIPLDAAFSQEAEAWAADYFLRGADATYAVVAKRHNCVLVSLDDEHRLRLANVLTVQTPTEALASITMGFSKE